MIAEPHAHHQKRVTKYHIRYKDREYFTENITLLLKSAVPIGDALQSLSRTTKNRDMQRALAQMGSDIDAGYSLADAMERANMVSHQTLALARLGEASGHLIENLEIAAQQEEKQHIFRSKIRSALLYPTFVLSLTLVVGLGVAWFLLPRLAETFSQLQVELPAISRILINFGVFLQHYGIVAIPVFLGGLFILGLILFTAPKTKIIGQRLLLVTPGVGRLMREVEISQFGYLLGTLLQAGLSVTQSVQLLANASSLQSYRHFYEFLAKALDDGHSFKEVFTMRPESAKLLPPSVQQMVIAGESSGSLPDVLLTTGRTYEQKSDITTNNLEVIIEPVLLVIVSVGVLLVAVAVLIPIYSLVGGLSS